MIRSWSIGDIRVTRLVEYYGPTHDPATTFPVFDRARFDRHVASLAPGDWLPEIGRLVIAVQIWIVFAGSNVILVDTGVGNHKPRPAARMNRLNTLVPLWLAAAGVTPEAVTHVAMTHLHNDHMGWNTVLEDGVFVPTFPNAQYLVPREDFAYFKELLDRGEAPDPSLEDSLLPVFESGLVRFVDRQPVIAGVLGVERAHGHTPGHTIYSIESNGLRGVFSGDVFHHPIQVYEPDWNTAFCVSPHDARVVRHALLERAAESGAFVMPCHFPPPGAGYIRREGDGYRFEPAE
jgi:glyoxylase-like metal-dependent hydrolase (beta-lactamase superfamily II)